MDVAAIVYAISVTHAEISVTGSALSVALFDSAEVMEVVALQSAMLFHIHAEGYKRHKRLVCGELHIAETTFNGGEDNRARE